MLHLLILRTTNNINSIDIDKASQVLAKGVPGVTLSIAFLQIIARLLGRLSIIVHAAGGDTSQGAGSTVPP
jgi:hypothetical protein